MKLTDSEKIEILQKYNDGQSCSSLSREYKVSRQAIMSILRVRGVKTRGQK
jgi:Mor family transcriptional regulator